MTATRTNCTSRIRHRPCPYRTRRKLPGRGAPFRDLCLRDGDSPGAAPFCDYCRDHDPIVHKPCKYRRREGRGGGKADWCHAIGAFERGDLPCEYCVDKKNERKST